MKENPAVKIAFFDIDGTILPFGRSEPSQKTVFALNELQKNGILLCVATGRCAAALPKLTGISFDVFMTYNGSYCYTGNDVICTCPLPAEDVLQILENTKRMNRAISISNGRFTVSNGTDEDLETYYSFSKSKNIIADDFELRCREEIYQIMLSCSPSEYDEILRGTTGTSVQAWWDKAADLVSADSGKGKAVESILSYFGFSKEEAIAFGDGSNDISMLQAVGTGIAMGNSNDDVKAAADAVCESADDDGVYHYLHDNIL